MKGTCLATVVISLLSPSMALAQTAPSSVVRPDIAGSLGWLNVNRNSLDRYNDWSNRGVHGAVTLGWYWSNHLKTELEASASTRTSFYSSGEQLIDGRRAYVASEYAFSTRRVTLGQQYQFGENAWFHPHLGAGLDFNWEQIDRFDREVVFFDSTARAPNVIRPPASHPQRTELHVRPFAAMGFKAYMTPRAFVRSDLRLVVERRIEEVALRLGIGVDF